VVPRSDSTYSGAFETTNASMHTPVGPVLAPVLALEPGKHRETSPVTSKRRISQMVPPSALLSSKDDVAFGD
jgi:hypothetical protein